MTASHHTRAMQRSETAPPGRGPASHSAAPSQMTADHPERLGPGVSIAGYSREQTVSDAGSWFVLALVAEHVVEQTLDIQALKGRWQKS